MAHILKIRMVLLGLLCILGLRTTAQQVVAGEWFAGDDPGFGQGNPLSITPGGFVTFSGELSVALDPGFQWISLRARDSEGHWSHTKYRQVYVRPNTADADLVAAEWYTDEDPGHGQGEVVTFPPSDTITGLPLEASFGPGELFRWVGLRTQDALGHWSHTRMRQVFVRPEAGGEIVSAEWFIGEDPGFGAANPIAIGDPAPVVEDILFEAMTQGLDAGPHVLFVRVFNDRGTPSLAYPAHFTIDTGTGLDLANAIGFTMGPNPTRDVLHLRADQAVEGMHLRLMDSGGRLLLQDRFTGHMDLDLSHHAQGTYYLFLADAEGKYTVFPVVKH
jgi:hypothetical protein